jgi:hypothetical protein
MQTAAKKVESLHTLIVQTTKKIDDLEWDGKLQQADKLRVHLDEYLDLFDKGEVYYPLF